MQKSVLLSAVFLEILVPAGLKSFAFFPFFWILEGDLPRPFFQASHANQDIYSGQISIVKRSFRNIKSSPRSKKGGKNPPFSSPCSLFRITPYPVKISVQLIGLYDTSCECVPIYSKGDEYLLQKSILKLRNYIPPYSEGVLKFWFKIS